MVRSYFAIQECCMEASMVPANTHEHGKKRIDEQFILNGSSRISSHACHFLNSLLYKMLGSWIARGGNAGRLSQKRG
jgi:hypothetical protein